MKNFNDDYEKLETENRTLMSTIEKSKYNVLEYSSQMQERDLQEQKILQDLDEYVFFYFHMISSKSLPLRNIQ